MSSFAELSPEFLSLQRVVAGRYSLERELGRGGMGVVFLARDVALDRPVAIKLLPPALSASDASRERFLREARTAARLSHPHIVPIHAVESHDDLAFFVMSWIDGETLGERVRRVGPLPPHEAMRIIQEVAWALGHAHAHGVVHRDVKPDNILLERGSGRALVTDFGIAHLEERADVSDPASVAGTPRWMSPEQAAGEPVDARTDVYALGLVAWYALTGSHPFEAGTLLALRQRQLTEAAPSLAGAHPSAPPALARVLERALAREPTHRFPSADEMAEAVRAARGADPVVAAPVRRFVADAEAAGGEIGTALTTGAVSFALHFGVYGLLVPEVSGALFAGVFNDIAYWSVMSVSLGLAGIRFGQLIDRARGLLRSGYGYDAVRPAIAMAERDRGEDRLAGAAQRRSVVRETAALGLLGAAKTALAIWLSDADVAGVFQMVGFVGTIAIPTVTIRKIWSEMRRDRPSLWNRLVSGRLGRAVFRIARIGLGDTPALPAAGEPTALAVGRAVDSLFDALPRAQRDQLRDVPRLIERLEADAMALRPPSGDANASARLATVVAALETLRLDLLRLHAGTATLDELTLHLDAARRIGDEIQARVELEGFLEESPTPA